MQLRVSILLPVRDAEPWLPEALASIRSQGLPDWELVAVDDTSSDRSRELLEAAARRDRRIRVLSVPESGGGLIGALEAGLDACRAPLIARMDADDVMAPDRLELQVDRLIEEPGLSGVSCRVRLFPRTGLREGSRIYEEWLNSLRAPEDITRERFVESPLPHPSVVVRAEVLRAARYRDRGWPEDYDLWLRLLGEGHRFAKIDRTLLLWRDHPTRASRRQARYARERFAECKAHHLRRGPLADRPFAIWGAGPTGKRLARLLSREGSGPSFFVDVDPRKIGQRIGGGPVVAPDELRGVWRREPSTILLVAVSRWGARQLIRDHLDGLERREGEAFWCVA